MKALWEERFEKKYGYWRGFVDSVVARYLDCEPRKRVSQGFNAGHAVPNDC